MAELIHRKGLNATSFIVRFIPYRMGTFDGGAQ
jgi:hypothetical protein